MTAHLLGLLLPDLLLERIGLFNSLQDLQKKPMQLCTGSYLSYLSFDLGVEGFEPST